jgi:hypothetical protein
MAHEEFPEEDFLELPVVATEALVVPLVSSLDVEALNLVSALSSASLLGSAMSVSIMK